MFLSYKSNSCYESDYACICFVINGKTHRVPLNVSSSVSLCKRYIRVCAPVRGDNTRALTSGLSHVQVNNRWSNYFILTV